MKFDICSSLLGFENIKKVQLEKIDDIFMKMVSVDDSNISFTLINPFVLRAYDFELTSQMQELLEATPESNLLILNIVVIQNPIEDSLINFLAPLIFNTDTNKAGQLILPDNQKYGIAEKISDYLNK
ncbi:MAG: flagellar assembly protein FliW [Sulfurimonas sp.]|jgi:flagellar assembly factor FliW|nr:flagellar assembly protein FliW [Sulfurimonas sp.]